MRFLVVDDSPEFRAAARELLQFEGHVVVDEVGDSKSALAAAMRLQPDAALIDVRLGQESGYAVSRALTSAQPGLAVLLVSVSDHVAADVVKECGARAFVEKQLLHTVDIAALLGSN